MNIGILGTGAMASFYAAKLGQSYDCTIIGTWKEQLSTIENDGLELIENGLSVIVDINTLNYNDINNHSFDILFIQTKTYQNKAVIGIINQLVHEGSIIINLQNGAGNKQFFESNIKKGHYIQATTTQAAFIEKPGLVRETGKGTINIPESQYSTGIKHLLDDCNFEIEITTDIDKIIWKKLVINACINPLTALLNINNGELVSNQSIHVIFRKVCQECDDILDELKVSLETNAYNLSSKVASFTADNSSSMRNDIKNEKPTEIGSIVGYMLSLSSQKHIYLPQMLEWIKSYDSTINYKELLLQIEETK